MKKILLILLVSLFLLNINAEGRQTLGPDLIIDSLTMNPFPVEPENNFDLTINIRNSNTRRTIYDLRFNIQESFPFTVEGGDKIKRLTSLAPNEQTLLTFRIKTDKNAIRGENELKLEFQEGGGVKYISSPINVDVKGTAIDLSIVSLVTNPSVITPGIEVEAVLTLKNAVPVLMKNIDINFDLSASDNPFTPIKSTTKRSITSLNKGDSKDLKFNLAVDAKAEPGVYKIPLKIDYEDEFGNEYSVDTLTGLKISTKPELKYSIETSEVYSSGSSGLVTIKIVNLGLADVKFLSLRLIESDDYDIISIPEIYLGNLESDDYETADFRIYASTRKDDLPLKVLVTYKDSFNEEYSVEETINMPLYSGYELSKFGLKTNGGVGFLTYVVLAIFAYLFVREWRKVRNVPKALKITVMHFLIFIKRAIKAMKIKNLKRVIEEIKKFFKEP